MADVEKLNSFLATQTYLGDEACATKEDYRVCASMPAASVDASKHPHLARWHTHITFLISKNAEFDFRGCPVPAGKNRFDGGAAAPAATPSAKAPAAKEAAAPAAASAGGAIDEAAIRAVGDEIRVLKEKLKGEGITGKKLNDHPDVGALVKKLSVLKEGGAAPAVAAAPAPKEAKKDAPKEAKKEKGAKKEKAEPAAEVELTPEQLAEAKKKKLKAVIKEGGKRGVEIEGAADMGGLQFFCTSMDLPDGDLDMLVESMKAMNQKSDPTEEERKGGSGHIGKMIFSAGTEQLAVVAYVPEEKQGELDCEEWLKTVLASQVGVLVTGDKTVSVGKVMADGNKNIFPLKIREPMILEANNFLRKKGLFPENDDSDDDEFIFGDDDFPS